MALVLCFFIFFYIFEIYFYNKTRVGYLIYSLFNHNSIFIYIQKTTITYLSKIIFRCNSWFVFFNNYDKNWTSITLGFSIFAFTVAYNTYVEELDQQWKLKRFEYYEMLILILTLIILDVTYPLLKPRIDILSVGNPTNGQLINDKSYAYREYALKVIPPLWPSDLSCKNIFIGTGTEFIQKSDYTGNLVIKFNPSNSVTTICTQGSFDVNRLFSLGVLEFYPLKYSGFASRLDRFYWIGENDTSRRLHSLSFFNDEEFPVLINSNLTFTIDNLTKFDKEFNMIKALTNESKKVNCKLNQFAMTPNLVNLTPLWVIRSYNKNKEFINISFSIFYTVPPNTQQNFYIIYYPYIC